MVSQLDARLRSWSLTMIASLCCANVNVVIYSEFGNCNIQEFLYSFSSGRESATLPRGGSQTKGTFRKVSDNNK